jgi:hypothetical protein
MPSLTPDERLHLYGGIAIAVILAGLILLLPTIGPGLTLALGSAIGGIGVEVYQHIRKEGDADPRDAAISASPGVLAGLVWWVLS